MTINCVVYNASHEPLAVVSAERGLVLHLEGKAIIIEEMPGRRFRSVREDHPVPKAVVLKDYVRTGSEYYKPASLNQRNLFLRDAYTCQYCGRHHLDLGRAEYLTRDHVLPQSAGGKDVWTNVATACSTCNHRKDDKPIGVFLEMLQQDARVLDEQLQRTTDKRRLTKLEAQRKQLQAMIGGAERVKRLMDGTGMPEPTVFTTLMHRASRHKKSA